jgi:hypothetical protein
MPNTLRYIKVDLENFNHFDPRESEGVEGWIGVFKVEDKEVSIRFEKGHLHFVFTLPKYYKACALKDLLKLVPTSDVPSINFKPPITFKQFRKQFSHLKW